jgi:hypothetical protein
MAYPEMLCPVIVVSNHRPHDWQDPEDKKWYHCPGSQPH